VSVSDALRNVLLFFPLGAALAAGSWTLAAGVGLGVAISISIELFQFFIPGRYPSAFDLFANAVGTALGIALVRSVPIWMFPSPTQAARLVAAAGLAAASVLITSGALFAPVPTWLALFGHHTPDALGHLFPYDGRVIAASVDGIDIGQGRLPDPERVRRRLAGDHELRLRVVAGHAPEGQAALLLITDVEQAEILLLGLERDDLVYRYRSRGAQLGLEQARLRLDGVLQGVPPGELLELSLRRIGGDVCIRIGAADHCGLGFTLGDGWLSLAPDSRLLDAGRPGLSIVWVAGLMLPLGFWARRDVVTALAGALVIGTLLWAPGWLGVLPTPRSQGIAAGLGAMAGVGIRKALELRGAARLLPESVDFAS
jgi:hypothetical protein